MFTTIDHNLEKAILQLGFTKNNTLIRRFIPHYRKGFEIIFIIGKDYWISKIIRISNAFQNSKWRVYGVLSDNYPSAALADWITQSPTLILLNPKTITKAQWDKTGNYIEWVRCYELDSRLHAS